MAIAGIVVLLIIIIGLLQWWLSTRRNPLFGKIIPILNMVSSTVFAMLTSDLFVAGLVFLLTLLPVIIWLVIYKFSRNRLNKRLEADLDLTNIKDLG